MTDTPLTLAGHRARLEEMAEALRANTAKASFAGARLQHYIRQHHLPAAVAQFLDGTFLIVWKDT